MVENSPDFFCSFSILGMCNRLSRTKDCVVDDRSSGFSGIGAIALTLASPLCSLQFRTWISETSSPPSQSRRCTNSASVAPKARIFFFCLSNKEWDPLLTSSCGESHSFRSRKQMSSPPRSPVPPQPLPLTGWGEHPTRRRGEETRGEERKQSWLNLM